MTEATTPFAAVRANGRRDATPGGVDGPGMRLSCTVLPTGRIAVIAAR